MATNESGRITMTEREFAARVGISRITAWRLRNSGKLPFCRVGNKVLYLERHIEEFLLAAEQRPRKLPRK